MTKYIAKHNTWFKEGTEAKLIDDYENDMGLFEGVRICENPKAEGKWHNIGDEYQDQEVCFLDEFEVIDD